jgi:hypothetical protein
MEHFEDENVNTLNLPKNQKIEEKISDLDANKITNLNNIIATNSSILPIVYKLSIQKGEKEILSGEFDELMKQIIDTNNTDFINGDINLIEYLISRYTNAPSTEIMNITTIKMKVKENFGMLNDFGLYMPNLKELNLSGSCIKSIHDIGSSFLNLVELNVSNCGVVDLSGNKIYLLY